MNRKPYPTDLTDKELEIFKAMLLEVNVVGRRGSVNLPEVANGILYRLRDGSAGEMLPHEIPLSKTVSDYFHISANGNP